MLGFCILSFVLIVVDHLSGYLDDIPADIPGREVREIREIFSSRDEMRSYIEILEQELILLKAKTEKMAALTAVNIPTLRVQNPAAG